MSKVMLNRLVPLWGSLCQSAQRDSCATSEDLTVFRTRANSEGLPYLTNGLAGIGRVFLDGIRKGYVTKEEFASVRQVAKEGSTLPLFLYSAWSKVFNDDGLGIGASFETDSCGNLVLTDWKPLIIAEVAVKWLRQLTVVFSKLRLPHDNAQCKAVFERFRANEEDLAQCKGILWRTQYAETTRFTHSGNRTQPLTEVLLNARRLLHRILCNVSPRDITPRHGSGASAEQTPPWERYDRILFDPDQSAIWPYLEFATAGKDHCDQILSSEFVNNGYPKRARGVFVQKDYRGPRLISCEPSTSMYYQQGLMTLLVEHLETHKYTAGFVNFTNQKRNQELAREGSLTRSLATLDLKDASDRLSWDLVVLLWPEDWRRALSAVRSKVTDIDVPGMGTMRVPLRKHAPMGSATCFPVMALTIWCIIKAANISARPKVWIYGDDIIVASRDAAEVCRLLESVHLAVNWNKSFSGSSPFRESCGKEYWNGSDVTPIYCRYDPSDDDSIQASLCSFANNMAQSRGVSANYELLELVQKMTELPVIGIPDGQMGHYEFDSDVGLIPLMAATLLDNTKWKTGVNQLPLVLLGTYSQCRLMTLRRRWHTDHQKWEYRIRRPYPVEKPVRPVTWGYILRDSLLRPLKGTVSRVGLGVAESAAVANRVCYKYGWVSLNW